LNSDSLPNFLNKLKEKKQAEIQQKQAHESVHLFYELARQQPGIKKVLDDLISQQDDEIGGNLKPDIRADSSLRNEKPTNHTKLPTMSKGVSNYKWQKIYNELNNEIKVRHYSPKTFKSYAIWTRKFQQFTKGKAPEVLSPSDVKDFLTFLAVRQKVSASSQNQAFNALLFLFRHILKKDFGKIDGVVRAKRKPYIPVVLSREEIDDIINNLLYPYNLMAKLLYGYGLRLSECLNLRVNNFDFDAGVLTVHDGKGKKDRTVPLPETLCRN